MTRPPVPALDRRRFLAAGLLPFAVGPRKAVATDRTEVDVVVVGAGAAGIAAARTLQAAGLSFLVLEAGPRIGGRCVTDTTLFGTAVDLGAHWIHAVDRTPFPALAAETGLTLVDAGRDFTLYDGRRRLGRAEQEAFHDAWEAADQAIVAAGRSGSDVAAAEVLPTGLGDWADPVAFALGPYGCAKDLDHVSTLDYARADEYPEVFVREGYGTLLARLAAGFPVGTSIPVTRIDRTGPRIRVETPVGTLAARAVLVTASTGALAAGTIRFDPPLPTDHEDALVGLSLGDYEHVVLEFPGNPLRFAIDEPVLFRRPGRRTGGVLGNIGGSGLVYVDVAGSFAADLARQGGRALVDFALALLTDTFGAEVRRHLGRTHATAWSREPFVLGAFSCAEPGRAGDRARLARPIDDRLWLAGEATHPSLWGTVGGAWADGERAAREIAERLIR